MGDGLWRVGVDIAPGVYRVEADDGCYWARVSDFSGSEIISNANPVGPTVVTIDPTDVGFQSQRCGTWVIQR